MLPELVAVNAAYAIDRKFIANGKEISDALARLKKFGRRRERLKSAGESQKRRFVCQSDG